MFEVTGIVMELAAKQELKNMDKRLSPETYATIMKQLAEFRPRTEPLKKPEKSLAAPSSLRRYDEIQQRINGFA